MINELSLLRLHPENASTKQKIVDILSNEWPLNAKEIHEKLQRFYTTEISYQGTHKTIQEMGEDNIIEKKGATYQLNLGWVQKSKRALEEVEKKYLHGKKIKIPTGFEGTIEINFDSYTELCVQTAELLLSRQLASAGEKEFICTLQYGWFPFKMNFAHFKLLADMVVANPGEKNIIRTKTPFGEWIRRQYNKINAVSAPIGTKVDFDEDVFVQGDYIIQIKFADETKQLIEMYYKKWKDMEDCFKDFGLKPEPKIHATMRITKNPEMAKYLRKQLEKVFEAGK